MRERLLVLVAAAVLCKDVEDGFDNHGGGECVSVYYPGACRVVDRCNAVSRVYGISVTV